MAHPLIDALPGFPVKISAVLPSLDKAWAEEGEDAARASGIDLGPSAVTQSVREIYGADLDARLEALADDERLAMSQSGLPPVRDCRFLV